MGVRVSICSLLVFRVLTIELLEECLTLTRQIQDDASPGRDSCPGQADVDRRQDK